ncbi:hypothetical protein [Facklamia miroungae]|uniref:Uncharacterized protein n=1 Tax=Facklamia miroungae TaxID=120956 RepID=A0A1G7VCD5_9LACT|nr:hypothetical protein [Facklamia miroungae]NKZ30303.1 hypothetical protein [Facklamia miroungae]SDG57221.1 hypothetical protein SAMN05421791_1181 [Facklamia miroungae]
MINLESILALEKANIEKTTDVMSLAKDSKVQMSAGHSGSGTSSSTPSYSKPNILNF